MRCIPKVFFSRDMRASLPAGVAIRNLGASMRQRRRYTSESTDLSILIVDFSSSLATRPSS
jgi:hypothetical protein